MIHSIEGFNALRESVEGKKLHDFTQPLVAEKDENVYLGYVPVYWDNADDSLREDDWKEVDIVTKGDAAAALTALQAVYGPLALLD